ncbi:hypothetical protein TBLA_0F01540 [Henningerozyma blattae CBS 6284]|uniref:BHLH domain-containing protein n=1 Tax=Henningerozyma blattae (strain ATCC 34711 / CBS 6284 / DSM 70876 / NBRC 10599 / NRRL Y-10934 / UCD 77-7) TaxID=1071380 RepID=I2H5P4_HENB6|nr:hypothetical protein TBLA_0F01540 [Tetrapisispora blattae CBS 6284]CCH61696.1 hypothetical protein TBLA_0F01540 [Tetrapisispora blattae CBS 6284]
MNPILAPSVSTTSNYSNTANTNNTNMMDASAINGGANATLDIWMQQDLLNNTQQGIPVSRGIVPSQNLTSYNNNKTTANNQQGKNDSANNIPEWFNPVDDNNCTSASSSSIASPLSDQLFMATNASHNVLLNSNTSFFASSAMVDNSNNINALMENDDENNDASNDRMFSAPSSYDNSPSNLPMIKKEENNTIDANLQSNINIKTEFTDLFSSFDVLSDSVSSTTNNETLTRSLNDDNLDANIDSITNNVSLTETSPSETTSVPQINQKKRRTTRKRLTPHQKEAHNKIEKRYRININTKIAKLQQIIPWVASEQTAFEVNDMGNKNMNNNNPLYQNPNNATRLNKSMILEKAVDYILYLQNNERLYEMEVTRLKNEVEALKNQK